MKFLQKGIFKLIRILTECDDEETNMECKTKKQINSNKKKISTVNLTSRML